jgi:hypothetical protein
VSRQQERIRVLTEGVKRYPALSSRGYTQKERDQMAKSGEALPSGAYPIRTKKDLQSALILAQSGHGNDDPTEIKKHIIGRAKVLGLTDMLPSDWRMFLLAYEARPARFA